MAEKQTGKQRTMRHDDKRVDTDSSVGMQGACTCAYYMCKTSVVGASNVGNIVCEWHEISRTFTRPAHLRRRQASQSPLFHKREEWKAKESRPGPATVTALSLKRAKMDAHTPFWIQQNMTRRIPRQPVYAGCAAAEGSIRELAFPRLRCGLVFAQHMARLQPRCGLFSQPCSHFCRSYKDRHCWLHVDMRLRGSENK
ncbi:hypothetical protein COCVIDRAFT_15458 [Bipolaris victoriae FI3]|uniref:Uncharacterized protein n=1 Tax=Bipolaris victoriae (strain FI3) TaxID=930091 RepID=W7EHY0_BIPV3|nr:hypothetical protein COCVIDRAFT_15458 [Bipolaris victoriae FI3]